jgi:hypothetical protein
MHFRDNWLVRNLWLARLRHQCLFAIEISKGDRAGSQRKADLKIRDFVEGNGSKFMVGIQYHDDGLVGYLAANRIAFVKLEGADFIKDSTENIWGPHWTPEGQKDVAERIYGHAVRQWRRTRSVQIGAIPHLPGTDCRF